MRLGTIEREPVITNVNVPMTAKSYRRWRRKLLQAAFATAVVGFFLGALFMGPW